MGEGSLDIKRPLGSAIAQTPELIKPGRPLLRLALTALQDLRSSTHILPVLNLVASIGAPFTASSAASAPVVTRYCVALNCCTPNQLRSVIMLV